MKSTIGQIVNPPCKRCGFKDPFHVGIEIYGPEGLEHSWCLNCAVILRSNFQLEMGIDFASTEISAITFFYPLLRMV